MLLISILLRLSVLLSQLSAPLNFISVVQCICVLVSDLWVLCHFSVSWLNILWSLCYIVSASPSIVLLRCGKVSCVKLQVLSQDFWHILLIFLLCGVTPLAAPLHVVSLHCLRSIFLSSNFFMPVLTGVFFLFFSLPPTSFCCTRAV